MYRVASSSLRGAPCLLRRSFVYSAATSSSPTATSSLSSSADQKRPFWASNLSSSTTTTSTPFGSGDTAETSKVPPAAFRKSKKVAAAAAAEEEEEDGEDATETATGSSKRTTTDIANELAATHDFSKAKAKKIVDSVFDTIAAVRVLFLLVCFYLRLHPNIFLIVQRLCFLTLPLSSLVLGAEFATEKNCFGFWLWYL